MPQVKRLGVAGSKAWRRRSVFLPGTCDTNQSNVPSSVAGLPSLFRPATINNQTCDVCQRVFLVDLLPSVEDGRCGRGLRSGLAGKVSFRRQYLARLPASHGPGRAFPRQDPQAKMKPCPKGSFCARCGRRRTLPHGAQTSHAILTSYIVILSERSWRYFRKLSQNDYL